MNTETRVREQFRESLAVKQRALEILPPQIAAAARRMAHCLAGNGKILACGNGGSAGDALHFASELLNRFERQRRALPAIALTADALTLTSVANDDAFEQVFARQVEALGRSGDLLLAISTSGQSPNVVAAARAARALGMGIIALSGKDGGALALALGGEDTEIRVPSDRTARIQEIHLTIIHMLCDWIDCQLFPLPDEGVPS